MYDKFLCYRDYIEIPKRVLTDEQYREYAVGLLEIGIYGNHETEDMIVKAFLEEKRAMIISTDRRYRHTTRCGELGGRKRKFADKRIKEVIAINGICTQKELADFFQCSLRTIQRRMSSQEIKRYYNETHKKK